jgi:O-6-methylguanine DNA methyltransferase
MGGKYMTGGCMSELVYRTAWLSPVGMLSLWEGEKGLVRVGLPNEEEAIVQRWASRYFGKDTEYIDVEPGAEVFRTVIGQLEGYFAGTQREFDLTLDLRGTPFQVSVWQVVSRVRWGETRSYGQVAAEIGQPSAVRAVGAANGANPIPIIVPCHRIIASNGALQGYGGGLALKAALLELEGLAFGSALLA